MLTNKRLFIVFAFSSIALIRGAASSSSNFDYHASLQEDADAQHALGQSILRGDIRDEKLMKYITKFSHQDIPSEIIARNHIKEIKERHPEWARSFNRKIKHLQDPDMYKRVPFPSRMLLWGPSGSGKTFTSLALAKVCNMQCLFIKGSTIETSFKNSGSVFLKKLFDTLQAHPERKFLVIFDEIKNLVQYSKDERDTSQHMTVATFWQYLDNIEKQRHICVIGTDNTDPQSYEKTIQTRFFESIFRFREADVLSLAKSIYFELTHEVETLPYDGLNLTMSESRLVEDIKDNIKSQFSTKILPKCTCNFMLETLQRYIQSVSYLSGREIRILVYRAIEAALEESYDKQSSSSVKSNNEILVEERHLLEVFKPHMKTFMQRFFAHHIPKSIFSARTLSYCVMTAGVGLRAYNEKYAKYALGLMYMGQIINVINTGNKERAQDAHVLSALMNISESYEGHRRYVDSMHRQQEAQDREEIRYNTSRHDRAEDLATAAERHQELLDNRREDIATSDERYNQARLDRAEDLVIAAERFAESHGLAIRSQFLKHIDMNLKNLDENIKAAKSIDGVNALWKDFEDTILMELNTAHREITRVEGYRGRTVSEYSRNLIWNFYQKNNRSCPEALKYFITSEYWCSK